MAFGDCADDEALRTGWKQFCRNLEDAGDRVFKDYNPPFGIHRVDGFRFLTQNLGQAFDLAFETKNTQFPVIHAFCSPFCKLGADNADYTYQQAWIDGHTTYKISGKMGTARFFNIAVQGEKPEHPPGKRGLHDPFGDTPETNLFGHDIVAGWDGSFELYVGGEKPDPKLCPNWLPTTPKTRKLFIRQGFDDWSEMPAQMRIERVGMAEPRPMPEPTEMITAMDWAGTFVSQMMIDWPDWSLQMSSALDPETLNAFPGQKRNTGDPVYNPELDKKRGRAMANMGWKLAPDEALIIEWEANDLFWQMTNMGPFMTSMDYLYRPVSYSPSRTKIDSDGKIRLILAHQDPGFHNWLDTQGFVSGHVTNRNNFTSEGTYFDTRVVKHAELAEHLPADSARVTPEERAQLLQQRYHSTLRRYLF